MSLEQVIRCDGDKPECVYFLQHPNYSEGFCKFEVYGQCEHPDRFEHFL